MEMFGICDGSVIRIKVEQAEMSDRVLRNLPVRDKLLFKLDDNTCVFSTGGGTSILIQRHIEILPITTHFIPKNICGVDRLVQSWERGTGLKATKKFPASSFGMRLYFAQSFLNYDGMLSVDSAPYLYFLGSGGLYVAPFKNVYATTGKICTGDGYERGFDGTLNSFEKLYQHFLVTPYNTDLGGIRHPAALQNAITWDLKTEECQCDMDSIKSQCKNIIGEKINRIECL